MFADDELQRGIGARRVQILGAMPQVEIDEPTSRIERDELLGLLNTTTSVDNQRITARMPVVTLQGLLEAEEEQAAPVPPPPVIVRFNSPLSPPSAVVKPFVTENGWVMLATSFAATITFGIAVLVTLM